MDAGRFDESGEEIRKTVKYIGGFPLTMRLPDMKKGKTQNERLEILAKIKDPSEFIATCRAMAAEENEISEDEMFPLAEDSLGDVMLNFVGIWLMTSVKLPIENKEQVIDHINKLIEMLKMLQDLPDDSEQLDQELLYCLKSAIAPRLWDIGLNR